MALTKVQTIGIETGISFTGVTTITSLNATQGANINISSPGVALTITQSGTGGYVQVGTSSTIAVIDNFGRLLVGVASTTSDTRAIFQGSSASATGGVNINLQRGSTPSTSGEKLGLFGFADVNGRSGAEISAFSDDTWNLNDYPSRVVISTTSDGAAAPDERLRIDSSGNLILASDTNTFIHHPSEDVIAVTASGTERFRVNPSGVNVTGIVTATTYRVGTATTLDASGLSVSAGVVTTTTLRVAAGSAAAPSITPTGDSDTGIFFPSADTIAFGEGGSEAARIDSSGRLLLGTSTDTTARLVVKGSAGSGDDGINVISGSTTVGSKAAIFFSPSTAGSFSTGSAIKAERLSPDGSDLQFYTCTALGSSPTERMRIDSSGRLLVGTSSSRSWSGISSQLQIESTSITSQSIIANTNDTLGGLLALGKSRGTSLGSNTVVQSGDLLGKIHFYGADGSALVQGAAIAAEVDGTPGANDMPGRLVFLTTADGASSPTARMRIGENGSIRAAGALADRLNAHSTASAGSIYSLFTGWHSASSGGINGTLSFNVTSNGNVQNTNGSYTALSDAKLKENIVDANSQWDDLKAIQIRNWNFKAETGHETHRQIGPIAQELEAVCPGLVFETPDRDEHGNETGEVTKGVNQSVLYMKAVKALQEAMERIEQLEAKVAALEAQ